ncbi:MAG TPA: ribbon-helix-helix domain-containing protein [Anaerolineae bacterium]|nr:ribbon-helix-helix domain-containing protein [Anaerolineae bacterium]
MAVYTRRVQAVLTEEQYQALSRLAEEMEKPLSVLIREAVEQVYLEQADQERRRAALRRLLALEAPVADWDQMEEEIIRGATA